MAWIVLLGIFHFCWVISRIWRLKMNFLGMNFPAFEDKNCCGECFKATI